jgi:hypothetical protein
MDYKKVIEEQIEELQKRQKKLEGKTVGIDEYLKITKTISELAVMASQL